MFLIAPRLSPAVSAVEPLGTLRQIVIGLELVEVACPEQVSELCELRVEGLGD